MGLTYEEFTEGRRWITQGRTVAEADVTLFCGLSGDFNPLHSDAAFSAGSGFGERIAHGPLVQAMAIGLMSQLNLINGTAMGLLNLNWDFRAPVHFGDTVHARISVASARPSKSGSGVVALRFEVLNHENQLVQEGQATLLMASDTRKRPLVEGAADVDNGGNIQSPGEWPE